MIIPSEDGRKERSVTTQRFWHNVALPDNETTVLRVAVLVGDSV